METWHLTLWTGVEEATPLGPAQAKDARACIYVHTAAYRENIYRSSIDSGEMWIVLLAKNG
jgi:hypothetical protein